MKQQIPRHKTNNAAREGYTQAKQSPKNSIIPVRQIPHQRQTPVEQSAVENTWNNNISDSSESGNEVRYQELRNEVQNQQLAVPIRRTQKRTLHYIDCELSGLDRVTKSEE